MAAQEIRVPDIGDFTDVPIIEIHVSPGDTVAAEDPLLTLESDKATLDVPSPVAGTISDLAVGVGDAVSQGTVIGTVEVAGAAGASEDAKEKVTSDTAATNGGSPETAAGPKEELTAPAGYGSSAGSPSGHGGGADGTNGRAPAGAPAPYTGEKGDVHAEVLVLGAGPGGYTAAFRAADLGKEVVMVDSRGPLGGVCLNIGCIPSKALLHAAKVIAETKEMSAHGVSFSAPSIDLDALRGWKDGVVNKLTGGLTGLAKQRKVRTVVGTGTFTSPNMLAVAGPDGSTTTVSFDSAIIAAGSEPVELPFIPHDDPRVIDSTGALELEDIPERLLVLGGGIIGLEMSTVYHELGSKISVVELMDQIIPGADKDLVTPLAKLLTKRYDAVWLGTKVTNVEAGPDGLTVSFDASASKDKQKAPESAVFDKILVAVGRKPSGRQVGADAAGVFVDERGFVPVDKQQRTNVAHIFAIGDVVGQPMLAHKATHEGKVAAENCAGHNSYFDATVIPSVAYTDPEVAWVGVTENEAKAAGVKYGKGVFPWAASGRSLALGRDEGLTKVLFDESTDRIIGCGIVGPSAGDLISEAALAIEIGADAADIGLTIHPHPTLSETVGMSAEAFEGTITDLYMPKKK
jgi:dihydrolipoamide dehydrogenase